MDITLKNRHVYTGLQLIAKFADRELPVKVSYACGKSLVGLNEQFQLIESERKKVVRKHQKKNPDGTPVTKKGTDGAGREVDVPDFDDEEAVRLELDSLEDEDIEISVHCITLDVWNEHMQTAECKECNRGPINVSSNEMAALIRLGILVD